MSETANFPNPTTCPEAENDTSYATEEDYGALAEKMGMSQTCVQEAKNTRKDMNTSTQAIAITAFGGGGVTANTHESEHDLGMTTAGCGKMSLTAETINKTKKTMTCTMNSTISDQSGGATNSSSLSIETVPMSERKVEGINTTAGEMFNKIADATMKATQMGWPPVAAHDGTPLDPESQEYIYKMFRATVEMVNNNIEMLTRAHALYVETNPIQSSVIGANLNQTIDSTLDVKSTQSADDTVKNMMIEDMKLIASATAIDKVSTTVGAGALLPNEKTSIITKVSEEIENQKTDITETITKNTMKVDADNNIKLRVEGSIIGSEVAQAIKSQVSLVIEQVTKKSLEIGNTIASDIISTTVTDKSTKSIQDGMDAIIEANEAGRAALAKEMYQTNEGAITAAGDAAAEAARGIGDGVSTAAKGIGSGIGSMMMAAMLPLIIVGVLVVGGLFVLPKLAPKLAAMSGASPGMIKYGGMALFALIVGLIIWFKVVPIFTKKDSRISYNKVNQRAPVQAIHSRTNKQSLAPYGKSLYYKGDRTARKIPSYTKINNSMNYKVPIARKFVNKYNPINDVTNVLGNHFPTMHIQNKVEEKPVMYTHTSRV